jgi:hypothetical protein
MAVLDFAIFAGLLCLSPDYGVHGAAPDLWQTARAGIIHRAVGI